MEPNRLEDKNHSIVSVRVPRMIPRPRLGGLTRPVGAALAACRSVVPQHARAARTGTVFARHGCERRTRGTSKQALSSRGIAVASGHSKKALPRSTIEMIGPPFVTRRQLQQLPPCAGEATLVGQLAEPVRHFSIVRPVDKQGAVPLLVHA